MAALAAYLLVVEYRFGGGGMRGFPMGAIFLGILANLVFVYACAAGLNGTADAISQEKREGTLGLLFLTDLKSYDVAFGKLFSASLNAFYALLVAVPVLAIAVLLGGVTGAMLWRMSLALLNMLFFASATGLMVSTLSQNARSAYGAATAILVLYLVCFSITSEALRATGKHGAAQFFEWINPGHTFALAQSPSRNAGPFWNSLLVTHLNAWAFFLMACWRLPRSWQDKGTLADVGWRGRWRQWCYGKAEVRRAFRESLVGVNPFYWMASRTRLGPAFVWLGTAIVLFLISLLHELSPHEVFMTFFVFQIILLHGMLKFWVATEASRNLEEQKHSGALELLLAGTPLSPREIVSGQWQALRRMFLRPTIVVLCIDIVLMALAPIDAHRMRSAFVSNEDLTNFTAAVVVGMIVLVADLWTMAWVAMWQAIKQTAPKRAAGWAIQQVLIWPWMIFVSLGVIAWGNSTSFPTGLIGWTGISLGLDFVLATRAKHKLLEQFRELATARFEHIGIMGKIGRFLGAAIRQRDGRGRVLKA